MKYFSKRVRRLFFLMVLLLGLAGLWTETGASEKPGEAGREADGALKIHMLDVGQGMCVLAESEGHYLLYDGGDGDTSSFVVSYLQQQGVEKLDYIVASHYDSDHLSGIIGALYAFDCGLILAPDYETDTKTYQSFLRAWKEQEVPLHYPVPGETYELGKAEFEIVGPYTYTYEKENDCSIALRLNYGETHCFLGGDGEEQSEGDMAASGVELESQLYVVNHHGSVSSSSPEFLERVQPEYAWISCGKGNAHGHPAVETLERLKQSGCELFRTDVQGTVIASSDGSAFSFNKEACRDWTPGATDGEKKETGYVCNENTGKFHYSGCASVEKMSEKNKRYANETREELIQEGYVPCKNCNP